jgi:hypothetical protein
MDEEVLEGDSEKEDFEKENSENECTVKLVNKEHFDKEQIGVKK